MRAIDWINTYEAATGNERVERIKQSTSASCVGTIDYCDIGLNFAWKGGKKLKQG